MEAIDDRAAPPPDRIKRRTVTWKCLVITIAVLFTPLVGVALWHLVPMGFDVIQSIRTTSTHKSLLAEKPDPSSDIYPLIDANTEFDVAVSVWARKANNDTTHPERLRREWDGEGEDGDLSISRLVKDQMGCSLGEAYYVPEETLIFSDVLFENFTLASKHRDVDIDFKLPLKRFGEEGIALRKTDVRVAVAFIPRSPSFLQDMVNVTTTWPANITLPPNIDPTLLDRLGEAHVGAPGSLKREAIESMSVSAGLIRFSQEERMVLNETEVAKAAAAGNLTALVKEIIDADKQADGGGTFMNESEGTSTTKTYGGKFHPFMNTRAHFYVLNEVRPFFAPSYRIRQTLYKMGVCRSRYLQSHLYCNGQPTYEDAGNWGTSVTFPSLNSSTADEEQQEVVKYGPYISALRHGHYKAMRLPDHAWAATQTEGETLDVHFNVMISSYTPLRLSFMDNIDIEHFPDEALHNATPTELQAVEDQWSFSHSLFVAPVSGVRPWTRIFFGVIETSVTFAILLLRMLYWYTRQTSTGISQSATFLSAAGTTAAFVDLYLNMSEAGMGVFFYLIMLWAGVSEGCTLFWQFRLVLPITLAKEGSKWKLRRRRWSHRERASMRTDPPLLLGVGIFLVAFATFAFVYKREITVLRGNMPLDELVSVTRHMTVCAFGISWMALQIIQNHRCRRFAGRYAVDTRLDVLRDVTRLAYYTRLVGTKPAQEPLVFEETVDIVLTAVMAWQSFKYRRVEQEVPAEDDE